MADVDEYFKVGVERHRRRLTSEKTGQKVRTQIDAEITEGAVCHQHY